MLVQKITFCVSICNAWRCEIFVRFLPNPEFLLDFFAALLYLKAPLSGLVVCIPGGRLRWRGKNSYHSVSSSLLLFVERGVAL